MKTRASLCLLTFAVSAAVHAQTGTGVTPDSFGPDRASGVFLNITREHRLGEGAQGIAVDRQQRVLVMNEWDQVGDSNHDCAVTRHLRNGRLLDMSYTGPQELEGTRRIGMDMGGTNLDVCTAIDTDGVNRAVITGLGDYGGGLSGFVMRLLATGAYDTGFAGDGKFALKNLDAFANTSTRLNHLQVLSDNRVLACGHVMRGSASHMLVLRISSGGSLDTSFNGTGYVEVSFSGGSNDADSCARLAVLPDGDIVLGGTANDAVGNLSYALVRLNANGSYDTGFSGDGQRLIDTGSQLAATPVLDDLAWDATRARLLVGCHLNFSANLDPSGCVLAITAAGNLDTSFDDDGRKGFRFSSYGGSSRDPGGTRLRRLLMRNDGSFYVLGTHTNSVADSAVHGSSDIVSMRMEADGSVNAGGGAAGAYSVDGIAFHSLDEVAQQGVDVADDRRVADTLIDATWYRDDLLLLAQRPRYPDHVFDHDGDGNLDEPGPVVPVIALVRAGDLFTSGFDFDGLDIPTTTPPIIATPAGFGHYCSVRSGTNPAIWGVLPQGAGSDPCQQFLDGNPNLIIERSGLYSLAGLNWVIGTCDGGYITLRGGNGSAPINTAFNDASGRNNCIFTAVPHEMAIFSRPYSGGHFGNAQAFNHDPYFYVPLDVTEFGQPSNGLRACIIDNRGRKRSIGNPDANPSTCDYDGSGVDEPATDIVLNSTRMVQSVAGGRVMMAVPRHIPLFTPPGNDPYQREIFVRHQVGSGRYAEVFSTYYAHMRDTAVRQGDAVSSGTSLGVMGTTGASSGEHLHISVARHRNLSWRKTFEYDFYAGAWDRAASMGAVDAWGWLAPQGVDPWAWRFRNHPSDPSRDNAGSFSTRLWIDGEAPTMN